ncbi:cytochrome p450 [Hirsutella rhossiliensis]|uniref:Cytochrome p450 domain-containing protein n=1 Tax=Hirsutella rhossiliensis TaxID=111463 RepID=A0A9P8MXV4_9HYPO|nr:cytochrome p450 domain-containing protein [Hirsutella rhossiliensis]KAH0962977.1 cytochrome p450 domain-containing protein [Hirsutella rhossiliensis]
MDSALAQGQGPSTSKPHLGLVDWRWPGYSLFFLLLLLACYSLKRRKKRPDHGDTVPYTLPFLRSAIPFVFDGLLFLQNATRQFPYASTLRVAILRDEAYLVQGPKNVAEIFHSTHLGVTRAYSLVLKQCFGMDQKAVAAYLADSSGSRHKPIPGSSPRPRERISFMTHENLVSGLLQNGLGPTTERFRTHLTTSLQASVTGQAWTEGPDLARFFEHHHGSALIRAVFGGEILHQNPDFVRDLWQYDKGVMSLARRLPWFCIPKTYRLREKLLAAVRRWHSDAPTGTTAAEAAGEPHRDPGWATGMMRERYTTLLGANGQDEASVASTDLAFIWASVTNVIPSSMTLALHVFRSPKLVSSLRSSLSRLQSPTAVQDLETVPLLLSIYAETLRSTVQIHIPRSAPFNELHVGGVTIPRNKLILVNTRLSHMDERVWNTKDGTRPLEQFWAQRFLVDPSDESSGPTRKRPASAGPGDKAHGHVYFSTDGLEGAWIPYGGGQHACPGRVLAKRIMLLSTALLVSTFDVEILADEAALAFDSARFGFGVSKPCRPIRFRVRRRMQAL